MAVVLTPAVRNAAKAVLMDGLRELIAGARVGVTNAVDTAGFIAGVAPSNPIGAFQHKAGRAACDRWARGPRDEILPGDDAVLRAACEQYLGPNAPGAPSTGSPFSGGQCEGVIYAITFTYNSINTDGSLSPTITTTRNAVGPIFGIEGNGSPAFQNIDAVTGSGNQGLLSGNCSQGCFRNPKIVSVAPLFSSAVDNCGDPPDEFDSGDPNPSPDPNPGPVGGPEGYPFPNLDIRVGPEGDIIVDFGDGEPPEVIDPSDPKGEGEGGAGGSSSGGAGPGDVGAAGASVDSGVGGESEGEAPEGQVLTGLKLEVLEFPPSRTLSQGDNFRAACYVYMGVPGLLDLDQAGLNLTQSQFVFAEKDNLTSWRVSANNGYNIRVTPYYRTPT